MAGGATNGTGAAPQAGVLEGVSPILWTAGNPISLFIIQAAIIVIFCRLLHFPLALIGQPRVIAEVVGGIVLGPSVMARIPGFREAIFPAASMPVLNNVANLGLMLFLFLVALELDIRLFTDNWRVALSVGLAGMILPFGLGCAIAWGIYNNFLDNAEQDRINFGVYALFIGTALAITAFPVLCRILTELKLLGSSVGVTVLAAGVGNDVTGWVLLALCVALVNNSSGLSALYALLCCIGWILLLTFGVRPIFHKIIKRTGSLEHGPTQEVVAITLLLTLISAWFTGIIGVHQIFGAFLVGLICPHDSGFAIKLTEKIEDLIAVLFLPLYFALSGLNTNLGLLNDGQAWSYTIAIIVIAFAGKIIGGTLAARACKLVWRESLTIGVFMSCKGLVELIVLNIGLQANILSVKTFTMFVVMALVTTVATTPLVKLLYPPWYQRKLERWKRGEIDWDGNVLNRDDASTATAESEKLEEPSVRRMLVQIRLDALPSLLGFIALLGGQRRNPAQQESTEGGNNEASKEAGESNAVVTSKPPLEVYGLRLLELTERTSSVMKVTEEENAHRDPILNVFTTFTQLQSCATGARISVVPTSAYVETITNQASDLESDFVLVPWGDKGKAFEDPSSSQFPSERESFMTIGQPYYDFIDDLFVKAHSNVGVLINKGQGRTLARAKISRTQSTKSFRSMRDNTLPPTGGRANHILLPFFGGSDDRFAARLVLQLTLNPHVTATIVHFALQSTDEADTPADTPASSQPAHTLSVKEDPFTAEDSVLIRKIQTSLPEIFKDRVTFEEMPTPINSVLKVVVDAAKEHLGNPRANNFVIVGRRHDGLADANTTRADLRKAIGIVGDRIVSSGLETSVIVVQAADPGASR